MNKLFVIPLLVILTSGLVLGGCAAPAPAPAPTPAPAPAPAPAPTPAPAPAPAPAPTPAPAPAPAPGTIKLIYQNQNPGTGWDATNASMPTLARMEEATKGKVKFETYFGETLCKGADSWEIIRTGVADLGWCFFPYWPGMAPLSDVMALPFIPYKSAEQASGILWQIYEKFPAIQDEFKANKMLFFWMSDPYILLTTKKQVKTLEDLKGMVLRATGGPPTDTTKALGATPQLFPMPDVYLNLQKGVLDGMWVPWEAYYSFKFYEVVKYQTVVPFCSNGPFAYAMNWKRWNSLPKDIQDQITGVTGLKGSTFYGKNMFDAMTIHARTTIKEISEKQGYNIVEYTIPPDELAKWKEVAGKPVWDSWVKKMEATGRPQAREILDTVLKLVETYTP